MHKRTFNMFRSLIYEKSGISINDKKENLVIARLNKRMRKLGIGSYDDYYSYLKYDKSGKEVVSMLNVISTNVTHFFREERHFDYLKKEMDVWIDSGQRRFRFWSAGCSTGEEPYSLAMTLNDYIIEYNADIRILATDLSVDVLVKCKNGIYDAEKVKNIPAQYRSKYFEKMGYNDNAEYTIKQNVKDMIHVRRLNFKERPFPLNGPLDAVFCRNVMIYFDTDMRRKVIEEFQRVIKPNGYLMIGHSESLTGVKPSKLKPVAPSIYKKLEE